MRRSAWRMMRETCIWLTPEDVADLALGHVQLEVHPQHAPVALGHHPQQALEHDALLRDVVGLVVEAEPVLQPRGAVVLAAELGLHRDRVARMVGVQRLEDALLGLVEPVGELGHGGRAAVLGQLGHRASTRSASSCSARGGRTDQVRSRK